MPRNRIVYASITMGILLLGWASRHYFGEVPFVRAYVGDALWALMVYFGLAFLLNRWSSKALALTALLFSFSIEVSQFYHAPWIDSLRATRLGGLVLGYSFVWTDLLCYIVGIAVGLLTDTWLSDRDRCV